jgi:tRNA (cytidine/uridine-2'-O-)-methyltransferase
MDYINECKIKSFKDFTEFKKDKKNERIILMTTKAKRKYFDFKFNQNDTILFGRESAGVPQLVHKNVDYKLIIPIQKKDRSLNIVSSVAITLAEALKQNQCL